jgi:DNA-directed RNA polymerase alpha subunit|uniref:DNA-directed RNA polymerase subunit alpha n=1 Tax=Parietochloris pseudoalveolaris TaxID=3102 RepID=A0A097KLL9_9CHLO|nr:alpha subunit of RNA polymerase [Parietochloris pseudoalveolaris]AIT94060.1 alpha subunit of RNA polymerase [Parietochloris pseudoalveolaris]
MEHVLLSCIESRVENNRSFYGRFQLGPFALGQGLTVANALRRSLLSELYGLAITAVEIEGVQHEYSTLPGVRESVLDILLNLKQIVFTGEFQITEPQIGYLYFQGPGIVRANNMKLPISIKCVDPEQYIATLSYDGVLRMKFVIWQGKHYSTQKNNVSFDSSLRLMAGNAISQTETKEKNEKDINKQSSSIILANSDTQTNLKFNKHQSSQLNHITNSEFRKSKNVLVLDGSFFPVNKVNFSLEIDDELQQPKDRVILEIWTNGSIHPRQAIHDSAKALIRLFYPFQEKRYLKNKFLNSRKVFQKKIIENKTNLKFLTKKHKISVEKKKASLDIGNLDLSLRPYTCLKQSKIETVGDLLQYSREELLSIKNFGKRSLQEVEINLDQMGLRLRSQKPNEP